MPRRLTVTLITVLVTIASVAVARSTARTDFAPALAAETVARDAAREHSYASFARPVSSEAVVDVLEAPAGLAVTDLSESATLPAVAETVTAASQVPAPVAIPAPIRTVVPQPVRTAAPTAKPVVAPPAPTAAAPATCPATWFCYPRLGISGPIVPYTDCSGSTDVGTAIRSYNCLSDHYLMAHAYTQFGLVRQWAAGDIVFAWGQRFTVTGAVTQQACGAPSFPLAALSMQTSLTSSACGSVLVVQAR